MQVVMQLPDKDSPGFLRRSKQAALFVNRLRAKEVDASVFDDMVEFLLPFVTEPQDRDAAREALWDASQAEFEKAMSALAGGAETVPPASAEG